MSEEVVSSTAAAGWYIVNGQQTYWNGTAWAVPVQVVRPPLPPYSTLAIAGFVLAVGGFFVFLLLPYFGAAGFVLSLLAIPRTNPGRLRGRWAAITGIAVGTIPAIWSIVGTIILIVSAASNH